MNFILSLECDDKVGIVASLSNVLAEKKINILVMREFVDKENARFFARLECEAKENVALVELEQLLKSKFGDEDIVKIHSPNSKRRVVILVTKEYHCLGDVLVKNSFGLLNAEICAVIGNRSNLREFTERFSVPFYHIPNEGKTKEEFESEVLAQIDVFKPDLLLLAKFMRILSSEFVARFPNRILNIHHSFLPAFIGANPYRQAFKRGVKIIGATAHFVTADLDDGPIITQQTKHVNHNFDPSELRNLGKEIERSVFMRALELVLHDRVFVVGNKTVILE